MGSCVFSRRGWKWGTPTRQLWSRSLPIPSLVAGITSLLEHDDMPPLDGVLSLLEQMEAHHEFSCIGGLYFTKGEGGVAQIWGDPKDPVLNFRPQLPDLSGGLVECCGTGMGFNLFRMKMFKDARLRKPWFVTQRTSGVSTQDLYFWGDARKHGYRCAIDCSVKV